MRLMLIWCCRFAVGVGWSGFDKVKVEHKSEAELLWEAAGDLLEDMVVAMESFGSDTIKANKSCKRIGVTESNRVVFMCLG